MATHLSLLSRIGASALLGLWLGCVCAQPAVLESHIELPGTNGRIDHLAIDLATNRLFVAALGADAIEVVDLRAARRAGTLRASGEPQGVVFLAARQRLFVSNGEGGNVQVFESGRQVRAVEGLPDADNLRLAPDGRRLFVGYGSGLAALDPQTLAITWRAALPAHPEAFELSPDGSRVYVNVPGARSIEVVDVAGGRSIASWSIAPLGGNFPMAFDSQGQRLFVATRSPAALLVLDASNGRLRHRQDLCSDADDLFFDAPRLRLYAICGQGELRVISTSEDRGYPVEQRVTTAPGARTGLFVPELGRLFVAARQGKRPAEILVFRLE